MQNRFIGIIAIIIVLTGLSRASDRLPNTMTYDSLAGSPNATLADVAWIAGHWTGEAFGGITEEVWTPPLGGSMMCAFKLVVDGKIDFYELCTITEENHTLLLKIKHFHPDLKGWEPGDESVEFRLVQITEQKVFFDGFTFENIGPDEINIYVVIGQENGEHEEVKFNYKRKI